VSHVANARHVRRWDQRQEKRDRTDRGDMRGGWRGGWRGEWRGEWRGWQNLGVALNSRNDALYAVVRGVILGDTRGVRSG